MLFDIPGMMHIGDNAVRIVDVMRDTIHANMYRKTNHESGLRIFSIEPFRTSKAYDAVKRTPSMKASWSSSCLTMGAFLRPLIERPPDGVGEARNVVLVCTRRFLRREMVLAV